MQIQQRKYTFPNLVCKTHNEFKNLVQKYLHTMSGKAQEEFKQIGLSGENIHKTRQEPLSNTKFVAPFWEDRKMGLMAYGKTGIALVEKWLVIMEGSNEIKNFKFSPLKTDISISEDTVFYYKSEFWTPMRNPKFYNGLWYNIPKKEKMLADWLGFLKQSIVSFITEYQSNKEKTENINFKIYITHLEEQTNFKPFREGKNHFNITFKTNLNLPINLHLGQGKGNGEGYFYLSKTELIPDKKTKHSANKK